MDSQSTTQKLLALLPPWSRYSRPLRVTFEAGGSPRDIAHGLSVIPDGYLLVWADAPIHATPGVLWTPTTAWLESGADNAHAIIIFFTLRESPTNA